MEKVLKEIKLVFPYFAKQIEGYASTNMKSRDGVIYLYPLPSIAEEAYLFTFYPIINNFSKLYLEHFESDIPQILNKFYQLFNGATLFHSYLEIWGFKVNDIISKNPSFDIRNENKIINKVFKNNKNMIGIASNNIGDTTLYNKERDSIHIFQSDGKESKSFESIDLWLGYEMEFGYEIYKEYIV